MVNYNSQQYQVTTDSQGYWSLEIENTFEPGLHAAIADSKALSIKDPALFGLQSFITRTPDQVMKAVEMPISWVILTLLCIVLFLASYAVALAKKYQKCEVDVEKLRLETKRKKVHHALFISGASVMLALFIAFGTTFTESLYKTDIAKLKNIASDITHKIIPEVRGQIINPINAQNIPNVSVVSGEVSSITSSSGMFRVFNVDTANGLILSHPSLAAKVKIPANSPTITLYFDSDAYNAVIQEVMSGKPTEIVEFSQIIYNQAEQRLIITAVSQDNKSVDYELDYKNSTWTLASR